MYFGTDESFQFSVVLVPNVDSSIRLLNPVRPRQLKKERNLQTT